MPARSSMAPPRRYASVAALLEYTLRGSGAMYAGQVRIGILWLIITLLGNAAFLVLMFTGFTGYAGDLSGVAIIGGFVLGIALFLWLLIRLAIVASFVQEVNPGGSQRW